MGPAPACVNGFSCYILLLSAFFLRFLPLNSPPLLLSYSRMLSLIFLSSIFQHLAWAVSLTSTGQTLVLNEVPYYVPAIPFAALQFPTSLQSAASAGGLVPVTVVKLPVSNATLSGRELEQAINGFGVDDVWNEGFMEGT